MLHLAAPFSIEIFQDICPRVKNINPPDKNGLTPLHIAAQNGHVNLVELIVSHNGDATNIQDGNKRIPLHYAAMNATSQPNCFAKDERSTCQHLEIAILLVDDCKDLNVKDDMGKSPSNYASMSGHFKIVDLIAKKTRSGPFRGTFGLKLIQGDTFEKKVPLFRLLRGSYVRKS